jgi:hypothetical protein
VIEASVNPDLVQVLALFLQGRRPLLPLLGGVVVAVALAAKATNLRPPREHLHHGAGNEVFQLLK